MRQLGLAAALAGLPAGIQPQGLLLGRRQIFVRFAGEAETATLYTADGLAGELKRLLAKSRFHSICLTGRDVLSNAEFIEGAFGSLESPVPVVLDTDGQRPDALQTIHGRVSLVQVRVDFGGPEAVVDRALQTLEAAARLNHEHGLILLPKEDTSDAQVLRVVGRASSISRATAVVVHPHAAPEAGQLLDRRWAALLEQMQLLHGDVRVMLRLPLPTGS